MADSPTNAINNAIDAFKEKAPEIVKDNKGALIGAALGYFLFGDDPKAQTAVLGAIAGSLLVDQKAKTEKAVKETE